MATVTITTTPAEDAAITTVIKSSLGGIKTKPETVDEYLNKLLRAHINQALDYQSLLDSQANAAAIVQVTPAEKAVIDSILDKYKTKDTTGALDGSK